MRVLKDIRVKKGMSIDDLAKATGYTKNTLYTWESDKVHSFSVRALHRLADALGVTVAEIADSDTARRGASAFGIGADGKICGEPLRDCFAYGGVYGGCTALASSEALYCVDPCGRRCAFYKTYAQHKADQAAAMARLAWIGGRQRHEQQR